MHKTIFITGSDTGVGKTVITSLLVDHLQNHGQDVLAVKPFSSGGGHDTELLYELQKRRIPRDVITLYSFEEPLTPLVAARLNRVQISEKRVLQHLKTLRQRTDWLLIEGAGGLLSPLGERLTFLDLIKALEGEVIVVALNRLGVLNQVLLLAEVLKERARGRFQFALNRPSVSDLSCESNAELLKEWLAPIGIREIPHIPLGGNGLPNTSKNAKKIKKTIAPLLGSDNLSLLLRRGKAG